jgi:hypothetical protein
VTAHAGFSNYWWSDGVTGQTRIIDSVGTYVAFGSRCGDSMLSDTFYITHLPDTVYAHHDTLACQSGDVGTLVTLTAPPGAGYLWYDGDTTATNVVHTSGAYWVRYHTACSLVSDTFHVAINPVPGPITGPTHLCPGDTARYTDATAGGRWHSGSLPVAVIDSMSGKVTAISAGTSNITYSAAGCSITKTLTVLAPPCFTAVPTAGLLPDAAIEPNPATTELTITAEPGSFTYYTITNTLGQQYLHAPLSRYDTRVDVRSLPPGLYYITLHGVYGNVVKKFVKL